MPTRLDRRLTARQLHRVRQVTELLVFSLLGLVVYRFTPVWQVPPFVRLVTALVVAVGGLVVYLGTWRGYLDELGRSDERVSDEQADLGRQAVNHEPREPRPSVLRGATLPVLLEPASPPAARHGTRTYQVPKRFGLPTMVFATTAVAIVAALFHTLHVTPVISMSVVGLLSLVSCLQIALDQVPRAASILGGTLCGIVAGIVLSYDQNFPLVSGVFYGGLTGAFCGYASGALIAGAFLSVEVISRWWRSGPQISENPTEDSLITVSKNPWSP